MVGIEQHVPSEAAATLIRATAEQILANGLALFDDVHEAVHANTPSDLRDDPALILEIERSNAAILGHWVQEMTIRPGERVEPVRTADTMDFARDVARRDLEDMTLNYFRVGLGVASQYVMEAAFAASSDPVVLHEALAAMLRSSADYVDANVAFIRDVIAQERAALAADGRGRRLDVIAGILEGDAGDTTAASARLGFELGRPLLACILWTDAPDGVESLSHLARELGRLVAARAVLQVPATAASVWAWIPTDRLPPRPAVAELLRVSPGARIALGSPGVGVAGFRAGHLEAARTQRVMHRLGSATPVASYEEIRAVALAGGDEPAAVEFARSVLGALADAPAVIRATARAVIEHGFDTTATARTLGVHRNTVLARMRRARELLPESGGERWIDIALALELDHWFEGAGGQAVASG